MGAKKKGGKKKGKGKKGKKLQVVQEETGELDLGQTCRNWYNTVVLIGNNIDAVAYPPGIAEIY